MECGASEGYDKLAEHQPRRALRIVAGVMAAVIVASVVVFVFVVAGRDDQGSAAGHDAMTQHADDVMPFDLEGTTHTFVKTDSGGIEEVVADVSSDTHNIDLVRSHLEFEASEFRNGNFSDPAKIHGTDMPGLKELEAGAGQVDVRYEAIPVGARITYSSTEHALVAALHAWFDRQTADHAMPGMGG